MPTRRAAAALLALIMASGPEEEEEEEDEGREDAAHGARSSYAHGTARQRRRLRFGNPRTTWARGRGLAAARSEAPLFRGGAPRGA